MSGSLFDRAVRLTEQDKAALLFRLWGFLEHDTPRFMEGAKIFITQLESEGGYHEETGCKDN